MIEVHAEFPQREVIQANAVVDNEEKTVSEVIISAKPEITGVTASIDNETGTPYVDVTETGTGIDFSFDLAFHNLKGDKGDTGATGATGQDGFSPSVTVEQTDSGATITATDKDGTTTANIYNGQDGADGTDGQDGQAATITVGSTTTGQAGTNASVVNSGTSSAAILDFTIPKGDKGVAGVSVTGVSLISTSGLQKTYRMTFSNNTYYDYIVTDGAAGDTSWGAISGTLSNQTDLQTELTGLQTQIDALVVSSDVFDVVGTYADLQAYDISTVPVNDIIKVLVDSAHSNAATYYRCVEVSNVKSWSYIGTEGAYYTKSETDTLLNAKYDSSNPNGYTSNVGTVTSVNNVLPDENGNVTISSGSSTDVQINGTSITSGGVANILTNSAYNASSNKIATMSDVPSISGLADIDLSNLSATGEAHFQSPLSQGTGISITNNTINHTNSVTAGTIGTSSATSGSTISVPYATYDAQGHITSKGTHTHTVTGFLTSSSTQVASSRFDGQWVHKYLDVSPSGTAAGSYSRSIASYLPSDAASSSGPYYEVLLMARSYSTSSTGSTLGVGTVASPYTNEADSFGYSGSLFANSNSRYDLTSTILIFGKGNTTLYWQISAGAQGANPIIKLYAYRRIGTNS